MRILSLLLLFLLLLPETGKASGPAAVQADNTQRYLSQRPAEGQRLFASTAVEDKIKEVSRLLTHAKLRWMFANCFPNTLDTTVHHRLDDNGVDDTFVYTGDIHAMWLRDSGAQVFPYVRLANEDPQLRRMLAGLIHRHTQCILLDPFANAFNDGPVPDGEWQKDYTAMKPELHERKWEIDSLCYAIRLAYEYWKETGDESVFTDNWVKAMELVVATFRDQQRREGRGSYRFQRKTERASDTMINNGWGAPVKPVGLIASAFRPSDDATTYLFLVPSNFFAVTSLRKAAGILTAVKDNRALAAECKLLADEVEAALREYAVYEHPVFGQIYAYEVDGFGNYNLMDDANVPSLLAMAYLGDVSADDPIYQNTRRFVWSDSNPYFFSGTAGEGVGGPHIGYDMVWPMSIMMKVFTSNDDQEIKKYVKMLVDTDADTGFMHESFHKDNPGKYTRKWFAWQNTLFGEMIIDLIDRGKLDVLNSIDQAGAEPEEEGLSLNVMTFNVRYNNPNDGRNAWPFRKDNAAQMIIDNEVDIVGMQEVLDDQRTDLDQLLAGYRSVGVGRADGKRKGEFSPIYYKEERFERVDWGTFWLSDEPLSVGTKGWDAAYPRIATWIILKDKASGVEVLALSTHLDHRGVQARPKSASLIISRVEALAGGRPIIVMGDFNSFPDSEAIAIMKSGEGKNRLHDSRELARRVIGYEGTAHDFGRTILNARARIDYIFVSGDIEVNLYETLPEKNERGYFSDHTPVLTKLSIR